jgi:histone H3/H4
MRAGFLMERGFPEKGVRRLLKDAGNDIIEILLISTSDLSVVRPVQAGEMLTFLRRIVSGYYDKEKLQIKPFLMGRDILKLGLKPSPTIGKILKKILEKQIQGSIKTREQALEYAKKMVDEHTVNGRRV